MSTETKDDDSQAEENRTKEKQDSPPPSGLREDPAPSAVVWIVRLVTAALLAWIVGYLLYLCFRTPQPVVFDITPDWENIRKVERGCVLPIDLTNASTEAVGQITLLAQNEPDSANPEVLQTTFALLGQGEMVRAELVFSKCPTREELELRVTSYQSP